MFHSWVCFRVTGSKLDLFNRIPDFHMAKIRCSRVVWTKKYKIFLSKSKSWWSKAVNRFQVSACQKPQLRKMCEKNGLTDWSLVSKKIISKCWRQTLFIYSGRFSCSGLNFVHLRKRYVKNGNPGEKNSILHQDFYSFWRCWGVESNRADALNPGSTRLKSRLNWKGIGWIKE